MGRHFSGDLVKINEKPGVLKFSGVGQSSRVWQGSAKLFTSFVRETSPHLGFSGIAVTFVYDIRVRLCDLLM